MNMNMKNEKCKTCAEDYCMRCHAMKLNSIVEGIKNENDYNEILLDNTISVLNQFVNVAEKISGKTF